jgi:hypothetical protein
MPDWMLCLCLWRASDNPRPVLHGNQYVQAVVLLLRISKNETKHARVCACVVER